MGRIRTQIKKTRTLGHGSSEKKEPPSITSLLEKAKSLITQCEYELAQKFAQRIVDRSPENIEARELLGIAQLENGDIQDAVQTFQSMIPPAPFASDPPPSSAYLYLAQLSDDDPRLALEHYQAAVNILFAKLKGKLPSTNSNEAEAAEEDAEIRKNIVRVLIAMVEIWMAPTYDLCFDPKAEETCDSLLRTAFETDSDNIEAFVSQASLRLSQQRPDEAKESALKAWNAMNGLDSDSPLLPPISTRIELAKRFIELEDFNSALQVIQGVMASDDQDVEAWYLEGWCFYLMAEQAKESGQKIDELSWEELAKDARDCLETCRTLHTNLQHPDEQILAHATELVSQLDALGIKPSPEDEEEWGGIGDDDGWEDTSDGVSDVEMG